MKLGVNIDHIATVRQARLTVEPDPVRLAVLAEMGGADSITVHLREDRRHIQDRDLRLLRETLSVALNMEMAVTEEMLRIARELKPQQVCLVPEKRSELTTEGGLRLEHNQPLLQRIIQDLQEQGTQVSLFIDPDEDSIRQAQALGASTVELHTGTWANAYLAAAQLASQQALQQRDRELQRLERAAALCAELSLILHVGHGISYRNVPDILHLPLLCELNIGHSIIAKALMIGLQAAVAEMKGLILRGPL